MNHVGYICNKHREERLSKWQEENKEVIIKPGDHIKISFEIGKEESKYETLWVLVTKVSPKSKTNIEIEGTIDNDPIHLNLKCGDPVKVLRTQICDYISN